MYTALYRKKRPTKFIDIIGQGPIVTTLTNQIKGKHISHAYLFCGTRGTGKTSTAKVFARAVNCTNAAEIGEPCNECETCKDILTDRNLNVIEIDAASNNGVENIRDLREEVKYLPTTGIYKVYIIDEAHMLTTAAFNALLKTLEEPPKHVIFILATTDPQKLPATILSRCQRYDFKRITRSDMAATLSAYMEKDNISADTDALEYIASVSDGAMRDALSILDQCISLYTTESITLDKVQNLLGAMDHTALFAYGEALIQMDSAAALAIIARAAKEGRDLSRFTADIITHFRNLLVAAQVTDHTDILDYSPETVERFRKQGIAVPPETLIGFIKEFSELQNQLRYSSQERLGLEVCTIKLCSQIEANTLPSTATTAEATFNTVATPVSKVDTSTLATEFPPADFEDVHSTPSTQQLPEENSLKENSLKGKSLSKSSEIERGWKAFCGSFDMLLKPMLSTSRVECDGNNITVICRNQASANYVNEQKNLISSELAKHFQLPEEPYIVITHNEGYNKESENEAFKESIRTQINMPVEFE